MDPFESFKAAQKQGWVHFAPYEAFTTPCAARLVKRAGVRSGQRVLDVACGTGVVSVTAARLGARVTGLDLTAAARPDLKVIVTSATIEPERFADALRRAPRSSRCPAGPTRSRSATGHWKSSAASNDDDDDPDDPDHEIVRTEMRDQTEAIVDAIAELENEPPGDVLVFLSGEREIRDTAEALTELQAHRGAAALRPAADGRAAEGVSRRTPAGASCSPPTSPRRR